jgi:hypothetical protein
MVDDNTYAKLLPIDGERFMCQGGEWRIAVSKYPIPEPTDLRYYELELKPTQDGKQEDVRHLTLILSDISLHHDNDGNYKAVIYGLIGDFLSTGKKEDRIEYLG